MQFLVRAFEQASLMAKFSQHSGLVLQVDASI
jgi:hypothetical protein